MSKYIDADAIPWHHDTFGNKIAYAEHINRMPEAPVVPAKTAVKIVVYNYEYMKVTICSNCETMVYDQYCPHCGCKFVGEVERKGYD